MKARHTSRHTSRRTLRRTSRRRLPVSVSVVALLLAVAALPLGHSCDRAPGATLPDVHPSDDEGEGAQLSIRRVWASSDRRRCPGGRH